MGKATAQRAEIEPESDFDGDAPEQVTLSTGREEAHKLRKEERENQRRVQADAKQRRQKSFARNKKEVPPDKQEEAPVAELLDEGGGKPVQYEQGNKRLKLVGHGLLDDSIVDFLSAQEKEVKEVIINAKEEVKTVKVKRHKEAGRRKQNEASNSLSRVKVILLEADRPHLANFRNAVEFKRTHLYGDHVRRSLRMLPKPRSE